MKLKSAGTVARTRVHHLTAAPVTAALELPSCFVPVVGHVEVAVRNRSQDLPVVAVQVDDRLAELVQFVF